MRQRLKKETLNDRENIQWVWPFPRLVRWRSGCSSLATWRQRAQVDDYLRSFNSKIFGINEGRGAQSSHIVTSSQHFPFLKLETVSLLAKKMMKMSSSECASECLQPERWKTLAALSRSCKECHKKVPAAVVLHPTYSSGAQTKPPSEKCTCKIWIDGGSLRI